MKVLFILVFLIVQGCSKEVPEEVINHAGCKSLAEELQADFEYSTEICTLKIEKEHFIIEDNRYLDGIRNGLVLLYNRPRLKNFYKCIDKELNGRDNYSLSTEEAITIDRKCKKINDIRNY